MSAAPPLRMLTFQRIVGCFWKSFRTTVSLHFTLSLYENNGKWKHNSVTLLTQWKWWEGRSHKVIGLGQGGGSAVIWEGTYFHSSDFRVVTGDMWREKQRIYMGYWKYMVKDDKRGGIFCDCDYRILRTKPPFTLFGFNVCFHGQRGPPGLFSATIKVNQPWPGGSIGWKVVP